MGKGLIYIVLFCDSRLTELTAALASVLLGFWFGVNWAHVVWIPFPESMPVGREHLLIHACGLLLMVAGLTKIVCLGINNVLWRKYSAMLAFSVWVFVAVALRGVPLPIIRFLFAPYFALINLLLCVRLILLVNAQENSETRNDAGHS